MFFDGTVFVKIHFTNSIISSYVIVDSSIMLPAYLPFPQAHVAGFRVYPFCTNFFLFFALTQTFATTKHTFSLTRYKFYWSFGSFVLVIKLKIFKFTFSVLFGTKILIDILLEYYNFNYIYLKGKCNWNYIYLKR